MSNEEFQKLVLEKFDKIDIRFDEIETELKEVKEKVKEVKTGIKEVKEIVLRTEEQTKDNTEFIHAIKEISKK